MSPDPTPSASHAVEPAVPQAPRQCRVCLDTETDLLGHLPQLRQLDPELARAAVFAADDLCVSCCLDLGRQSWTYLKQGHPDANVGAAYAAESLCGKQRPS